MTEKVTAGRDAMGVFAPKFAALNDDVLFGEVWSRTTQLPARDRSIVTVTALLSSGILDSSLEHHLRLAKANSVTAEEIAEVITHAAFYAGWPKAWAALRLAKDIYAQ
ncbi:carboxymuconolactone decarboxylase family protein [Glutamicibacter sp.]|uniref:carboxymuconolactone decarboxylase family protein n=1 Tax=Glutamicibacter sp. TaxID=1931995 RepID=UPI002FDFDD6F